MRRPIIAGNWKMNKTTQEAEQLVLALKQQLQAIKDVDIVVAPPFTSLSAVAKVIQGTNIQLAAQNVYWENSGAYTGEISCEMLKTIGCRYVIIGHSERRTYFSETNQTVNKKVKQALKYNLFAIMCVGERLEEREKGQTFTVVQSHIEGGLAGISSEQMKNIIIAYEPVWAIGTGKTATPEEAQEVQKFIRELLTKTYGKKISALLRIQYGGSVKPDNIKELMAQQDIDGALVGGASLKPDSFVQIVKGGRP